MDAPTPSDPVPDPGPDLGPDLGPKPLPDLATNPGPDSSSAGSPDRDPVGNPTSPERPAPRLLPPLSASPPPQSPPQSPPPAPASALPPQQRHDSGPGWRLVIALVLIALLAGAGLAALVAVKFLKADVRSAAAVAPSPASAGQPPVALAANRPAAAVPMLDLAAASTRQAALAAELTALEARAAAVDRDSQRAASYATRSEGLMIAFAARRAIDRGVNLGFLEAQLRARFAATQPAAVATIIQAGREPVTLEDLRAGLDGVMPELLTGVASNGWWHSLGDEVAHLIVLRRAGTPSPLPIDRVAAARRLLEAGKVEAALAEVSRTPGVARAGRWTSAARRYADVRRALDTIESAAILAPGVDAAPPAAAAPAPAPPPPATLTAPPAVAPAAPPAHAPAGATAQ